MSKRIVRGVGNINDFPDDVLCHIISFLPFKEAVRTSILSTRWRNLFTLLSNIDLEVRAYNVEQWKRFMSFVDRLMSSLHMPSVVRFRLKCGGCSSHAKKKEFGGFIRRVCHWIRALIRHNIQELDIEIDSWVYNSLVLPPNLFSCESLVVLKLKLHCIGKSMQKIPDRISLPNLKVIHFEGTNLSNDAEKLISSCPVLEDLVLDRCWFLGSSARFSVSNQNLKTLTLRDISSEGGRTRILINAPGLVILSHGVSVYYSLEFVDVKSLSEAIITSSIFVPVEFFTTTPDAISWIQNIEALSIYFSLARETYADPIGFDSIGLEHFLARCVVLETLVFEESQMLRDLRHTNKHTNKRYSLKEPQLAPLLQHLKTIEIQLLDIGHVIVLMGVIQFFLKSAKVLEVLKISSKQGSSEEQSKITTTIMNFPRASKKCRVLFASYTYK